VLDKDNDAIIVVQVGMVILFQGIRSNAELIAEVASVRMNTRESTVFNMNGEKQFRQSHIGRVV